MYINCKGHFYPVNHALPALTYIMLTGIVHIAVEGVPNDSLCVLVLFCAPSKRRIKHADS